MIHLRHAEQSRLRAYVACESGHQDAMEPVQPSSTYYSNKEETLKHLFAARNIEVTEHLLMVDGRTYPIVNDVIILTDSDLIDSAREVQFTFGEEWTRFP